MAEAYRVIAQASPAVNSDTTLYTVPASTQVIVSTLTVCNTGTAQALFRVAVRKAGAVLTTAHYIYYDAALAPSSTVAVTIGLTLDATDVVTIRSSTAGVAFSLFGTVVTP